MFCHHIFTKYGNDSLNESFFCQMEHCAEAEKEERRIASRDYTAL